MNNYRQVGNGPVRVVALNGWFGSSADWDAMIPCLDTDAFAYVFFDYRGYGRSLHVDGQFNFTEAAQDVLRLADHLQWERFSLIGHSMGGMAIQRILLAAADRVERMVAVTAVPASGSGMPDDRLALFKRAVDDLPARESIINASTGSRLTKQWVAHMARQSDASSGRTAFGAYLDEWSRADFSPLVQGNPVPVKVIVGEHDASLSAERMKQTWLKWYPNAELEVLANTGHYPMHEVPLALAASIQEFLGR
jgi:esterase